MSYVRTPEEAEAMVQRAELAEIDRDEWKAQHENLLAMYQKVIEEKAQLRKVFVAADAWVSSFHELNPQYRVVEDELTKQVLAYRDRE